MAVRVPNALMGAMRFAVPGADEIEEEERTSPGLIDPLQVPDVFATDIDVEMLRDHVRIVLSAVRRNEFGDPVRPVVSRTVLTVDALFACLETLLGTMAEAPDPRVQARLLALLGRLMRRLGAPPGGMAN